MRRIAWTVLGGLAVTAWAGCQTVGPSALSRPGHSDGLAGPGSSYTGGRAVQTFAQAPAAVQPAVAEALDDLRVQSVRQVKEGGAILFEGTTADRRRVAVTLRAQPGGTRLSARIGLFGDEPFSRALMDRVGTRLGTLPPSAIPVDPPSEPAANPYFSRDAVADSEMFKEQAEAPYRGTVVP